eukprot:CAMPEP_0197654748 /NCGR_PEP_ID=MMETSP1338-20131121/39033_1 /TAXON_ID=43686 ORGANISM="Pelagodinium beii, Strain RCC1491" /NCGR_SAMPLE_ID=MMETSP1338 /ASSEMBLY_ACC=CAM_ASM_000754 /LENGTH=317 /DNA_ID=CAMNT_0043230247 /DNA_START=219 /DNA_END=1172 /DNA_ORIENTATION=+
MLVQVTCRDGWDGLGCKQEEIKWVIGRGLTGTLQFVFAVLAAVAGVGLGDIGALSSVNTVVAAVLGRYILGERLGPLHVGAMLFSIAGAVLISDPAKMGSQGHAFAWLGYSLALLSGVSFGLMFICTRKSRSASTMLLTVSAMSQRGMVCWILAGTPAVNDFSYAKVVLKPGRAVGFLGLLIAITFSGNALASVGAKRCPAAISATLMTAVSMGVGYGAQIVIIHQIPNTFTITGAMLMLLSVVTMATARLPAPSASVSVELSEVPQTPSSVRSALSLASFVASEYAERQQAEAMPAAPASELRPRPVTVGGAQAYA